MNPSGSINQSYDHMVLSLIEPHNYLTTMLTLMRLLQKQRHMLAFTQPYALFPIFKVNEINVGLKSMCSLAS